MEMANLQDLFMDQLKDVYDAEAQLTKALPKMAKAATYPELKQAFQTHLLETKGQIERLQRVFELFGEKAKGKHCPAMEGLIEEGKELLEEDAAPDVLDAGLIGAAQKVEHYEIATYGTLRTYAELLGNNQAARILQQILDEEGKTDKKLTELAVSCINLEAQDGEDDAGTSRLSASASASRSRGVRKASSARRRS